MTMMMLQYDKMFPIAIFINNMTKYCADSIYHFVNLILLKKWFKKSKTSFSYLDWLVFKLL